MQKMVVTDRYMYGVFYVHYIILKKIKYSQIKDIMQ